MFLQKIYYSQLRITHVHFLSRQLIKIKFHLDYYKNSPKLTKLRMHGFFCTRYHLQTNINSLRTVCVHS